MDRSDLEVLKINQLRALKLNLSTNGSRTDLLDRITVYYQHNGWPRHLDVEAMSETGSVASDTEILVNVPGAEKQWLSSQDGANKGESNQLQPPIISAGEESSSSQNMQVMDSMREMARAIQSLSRAVSVIEERQRTGTINADEPQRSRSELRSANVDRNAYENRNKWP